MTVEAKVKANAKAAAAPKAAAEPTTTEIHNALKNFAKSRKVSLSAFGTAVRPERLRDALVELESAGKVRLAVVAGGKAGPGCIEIAGRGFVTQVELVG